MFSQLGSDPSSKSLNFKERFLLTWSVSTAYIIQITDLTLPSLSLTLLTTTPQSVTQRLLQDRGKVMDLWFLKTTDCTVCFRNKASVMGMGVSPGVYADVSMQMSCLPNIKFLYQHHVGQNHNIIIMKVKFLNYTSLC